MQLAMTADNTRRRSASRTTMTEYVLPTHANALGNVFGGQVLAWMDICAAICAQRHCGGIAVTAGIDELSFDGPIRVGQVCRIEAEISATFRTSLEIDVQVIGENAATGETWPCVRAFLSFVAIDDKGKPRPIPQVRMEIDEHEAMQASAQERRQDRLDHRRERSARRATQAEQS